ncbi:glycosyltransferase family 2 protein [Haloarchaeobius sp. DFWS5]|uniref:glycosyltransferase family 2 protein n=1 Tax=Haloarchaeobius sp. DFWS5 TaxID=3446114 RepID=UPI003EB98D46
MTSTAALALATVQAVGVLVGLVFTVYMLAGLLGSLFYSTEKADERAENARIVITTVASERVAPALRETIEQTLETFEDYEVYCLLDEGSDLEAELTAWDGLRTVVVPDDYECTAIAKGRAINYYIETVVSREPSYWYAFIDDDNRVLDDTFLYEIPHYEARGYRATNPVLDPRPGRSMLTFLADQIRYVDDIAIYRLFTGILGRPYLGFHGELLCVRGDVLADIGFDRQSIVEDFAFALELVEAEVPVWQSETRISVLSPHDVTAFLKQRARWYVGVLAYLPKAPMLSRLVVGTRIVTWSVAVTSSWVFMPVWVLGYGVDAPPVLLAAMIVGTLIYVGTIARGARQIGGVRGISYLLLTPICALIEHLVPLYALATRQRDFVVIEK